jgi:RNA polymerase sigma-70 factor (family 1)
MSTSADYNEKDLLNALSNSDHAAFETLYCSYKDKLYSFLYNLTDSEVVSQDLVQEIFLNIWQKRTNVKSIENFGGYLFNAVRNHAINSIRSRDRTNRLMTELSQRPDDIVQLDDLFAARELAAALEQVLQILPLQQRRVFELSRNNGMKYSDIAAHLGISVATVRNHMIQALKKIREHLGDDYPIVIIVMIWTNC